MRIESGFFFMPFVPFPFLEAKQNWGKRRRRRRSDALRCVS